MLKYLLLNVPPMELLNEMIAAIKMGRTIYIDDDFFCVRPIKISFNDYDGQDESGYFHPHRVYHIDINVIGWTNSAAHIILELPDNELQLILREGPSPNTSYISSDSLWDHTTKKAELYWPYFRNSYTITEKVIIEARRCHKCNNMVEIYKTISAVKATTSCTVCGNENTYYFPRQGE